VGQEGTTIMRKFLTAALCAVTLIGGGVMTAASPASAATNSPCISHAEYRAIRHGMTVTRVAAIVGSRGKVSVTSSYGGFTMTIRSWQDCGQIHGLTSNASFINGRVSAKTGLFW
jgi:hypothetical protein